MIRQINNYLFSAGCKLTLHAFLHAVAMIETLLILINGAHSSYFVKIQVEIFIYSRIITQELPYYVSQF